MANLRRRFPYVSLVSFSDMDETSCKSVIPKLHAAFVKVFA